MTGTEFQRRLEALIAAHKRPWIGLRKRAKRSPFFCARRAARSIPKPATQFGAHL